MIALIAVFAFFCGHKQLRRRHEKYAFHLVCADSRMRKDQGMIIDDDKTATPFIVNTGSPHVNKGSPQVVQYKVDAAAPLVHARSRTANVSHPPVVASTSPLLPWNRTTQLPEPQSQPLKVSNEPYSIRAGHEVDGSAVDGVQPVYDTKWQSHPAAQLKAETLALSSPNR